MVVRRGVRLRAYIGEFVEIRDIGQGGGDGSDGGMGNLRDADGGEGGEVGESGSWRGNRERGKADRDSWMAKGRGSWAMEVEEEWGCGGTTNLSGGGSGGWGGNHLDNAE